MVPQHGRFNRGIWAHFEGLVRNWAVARKMVYVITGAVFDRNNDGKPDPLDETQWVLPTKRVGIPSHFYKILFHAGATLDSLAVMLPHVDASPSNRNEFLRQHRVSIREIENRTGLNFLPGLGPLSQEAIESIVAPDLWPTLSQ
jgi:endonuclease G